MHILYTLLLLVVIGAYVLGYYLFEKKNIKIFEQYNRLPASDIRDGIKYYSLEFKWLVIKTSLSAIAPAIVIGSVAAVYWGPIALLFIPVFGLGLYGANIFLATYISAKFDGKGLGAITSKIFGATPAIIIKWLEMISRSIYVILTMYIAVILLPNVIGFNQFLMIPVMLIIWYWQVLSKSLRGRERTGLYINFVFIALTIIALFLMLINADLLYGWSSMSKIDGSQKPFTELFIVFAMGLYSMKSYNDVHAVNRHSWHQKDLNRAMLIKRITTTVVIFIWTTISLSAYSFNPTLFDGNYFDNFINLLRILMSENFLKIFLFILSIGIIINIELDITKIKDLVIKTKRWNRLDSKIQSRMILVQVLTCFLVPFILERIGMENSLWTVWGLLATLTLVLYTSVIVVQAWQQYKFWYVLIPMAQLVVLTFILSHNFITFITFNEVEDYLILVFSGSMAVIAALIMFAKAYTYKRSVWIVERGRHVTWR